MPVRVSDQIQGTQRATSAMAIRWADTHGAIRKQEVFSFLVELERLCRVYRLDFTILSAQSAHETDDWRSDEWVQYLNPAGIGKFPDGTREGNGWQDGIDAARAMIVHMLIYVVGRGGMGEIPEGWRALDPRLDDVIAKRWDGTVRHIGQLTGKWATDTKYAAKVAAKANAMYPMIGDQEGTAMQFGNVIHPPFIDRLIPDIQTAAYEQSGQRRALGVCQHSMVGSLWGTDGWFRRGRGVSTGLTDYGIGNSTDGAQWDGVIIRWNDPKGKVATVFKDTQNGYHAKEDPAKGIYAYKVSGNRSGWANGGSDGLEGDGPLFVRTLGVEAINRDLVSIERSDGGRTDTPMSQKQFDAIVRLTAHWIDQARIPWDRYPVNPAFGVVTHLLHLEFATKTCPHAPVTSRIDEIQNAVRAILKAAQTKVEGTPVEPRPTPVEQDNDWLPNGWTESAIREHLGPLKVFEVGESDPIERRFSMKGVISNAIIARAVKEGVTKLEDLPTWATLHHLEADGDQRPSILTFHGSRTNAWTLFRPTDGVAWRWIQ